MDAQGFLSNQVIEASNDTDITDATSVIIGSELALSERKSLIDGFVNYIEETREKGTRLWNRRGRGGQRPLEIGQ